MTTIKDFTQDLVKNVISTGFFDKIKIDATKGTDILVESVDKDKTVVLKGIIKNNKSADLKGEFGLTNLSLLQHIVSDPEFSKPESNMTITTKQDEKNGKEYPTELAYINKSKSYINYRFMPLSLVPNQPTFREQEWDVVVSEPSKDSIQQFAWAASGLSAYEQYIIPKVVDRQLRFYIGEENSAAQRGGVVIADNVDGKFDYGMQWKIGLVLGVLKLASNSHCKLSFSKKGAFQVEIDTGVGVYKFIFPSKA